MYTEGFNDLKTVSDSGEEYTFLWAVLSFELDKNAQGLFQ